MAQELIDVGTGVGDGSGDIVRVAYIKSNNNFTELYGLSKSNQIVVKQASDFGVIDSTKEYFIDGVIDMGTTQIDLSGGKKLNLKGYDFNISGLTSTADNYTMITGADASDVLMFDFYFEVSGTNSKVQDIKGATGFEAYEISRINFNNCTSRGEIENYRQGLETGTGYFGGKPELTLSGVWLGGYFIDVSIVRGLTDGAYSLFKAGTGFSMASRFRSNQNIDLPASASFFDFSASNFVNPSTVDISGARVSRNGVINSNDANITPNLTASDLPCYWRGNQGMPNTFIGGNLRVTTEVTTTITTAGVFVDLAGVYTPSDLQHFDEPSNGQLRHLGDSPREYKVIVDVLIDSNSNNEVDLKVVVWDNSASSFVDYKVQRRVVNNFQGGRDVAFFNFTGNIILDKNDYVKLMTANVNTTNNITAELGSEFTIEER